MSLLTLSDFTPLRRARAAAPSLSLSLRRGELTVLVGPNGCGKSTHLAALSGGLPYSGSARLSESELSSLSPRERARLVSLAPQFPTRPHLPLSSALAMARVPYLSLGARLAEDDREAIASAVSLCGVESYLERTLDTLSGGELCRASLAITLAQGCPLLCLDEITAHLDPASSGEILALVRRLCTEEGYTVLLVLHDLASAVAIADRIAVLDRGGLLAFAPTDEILSSGVLESTFGVRRHLSLDGRIFFDALSF